MTQIIGRWIRLNDDICPTCDNPTWIKLDIHPDPPEDFHPIVSTITCQCGEMNISENTPGWAQIDNMTTHDLIAILAEMAK